MLKSGDSLAQFVETTQESVHIPQKEYDPVCAGVLLGISLAYYIVPTYSSL